MGFEITWRSAKGRRTADNRDFCGLGFLDGTALCIVLDGSTSAPDSGEFARLIARSIVDWFMGVGQFSEQAFMEELRKVHQALVPEYRRASASFVIAHVTSEGRVRLFSIGDCLAGISTDGNPITWKTQPHTLANALKEKPIEEIVDSPSRNVLTRSFRGRAFAVPDVSELELQPDQTLILATDGFWAVLDPETPAQISSGHGEQNCELNDQDDCSSLQIRLVEGVGCRLDEDATDNQYVRVSK